MAAAAQPEMVKITINEIEIEVPKGELIVESVKRLGLEIPIFCYHPRMKPVGMCRMCLVEVGFRQPDGSVRKMPKPQAGCTLPADNNMVVYTDTELVHRDRKGVLEFLLINHPLDCPICDRGGECPLQNNTLTYGPSTSRFVELKRHLPKAYPLSEYVTLDLERCIQCGRCVRFTEEISGDSQLAFRFRGASMQPSTYQLTNFESKFSGNVIEICPVGALTSSKYRFRARPWDLETRPAICTVTPCGTNVWFDYRAGRFVRINGRTNEAVNEEWTCDRTKFGHEFYNSPNRVVAANIRTADGAFRGATWAEAYAEVLNHFKPGASVGVIAGEDLANEDYAELASLFRAGFQSESVDHRHRGPWLTDQERSDATSGRPAVQTTISDLETADCVVVFGTNLADDAPMSYLRLRKGWFQKGTRVIVAHHEVSEAESFASTTVRYSGGDEAQAATALATGAAGAGFSAEALRAVQEATAKGDVIVLTTASLLRTSPIAVRTISDWAHKIGAKFSVLATGPNEQGAMEVGFLPGDNGHSTRAMLEAARDGKLSALWLAGGDLLRDFPDRDLAVAALENVPFLVVQAAVENEACAYASVILPMTLPAEQDGTYTNYERRVQLMRQILPSLGEAKPVWRVAAELQARMRPMTPPFGAKEVFTKLAASNDAFSGLSYDSLPGEGAILGSTKPVAEATV